MGNICGAAGAARNRKKDPATFKLVIIGDYAGKKDLAFTCVRALAAGVEGQRRSFTAFTTPRCPAPFLPVPSTR